MLRKAFSFLRLPYSYEETSGGIHTYLEQRQVFLPDKAKEGIVPSTLKKFKVLSKA